MPTLICDGNLNLAELAKKSEKPPCFELSSELFWNDPYIAQQMLTAHLDPQTDAASRIPQTIDQTVKWIYDALKLQPGMRLLDLGCGPGLYCKRFAQQGLKVTGVDFSENSLRYARENDSTSEYICQNYLTLGPFEQKFEAVTLIYGDFCVLREHDRAQLLHAIYDSLKPNGYFIFDVTTRAHFGEAKGSQTWMVADQGGFWKPEPYLLLMDRFDYPDEHVILDQYLVIEETGELSLYRNWFQCYSLETITTELERSNFKVVNAYSDLTGSPFSPSSEWIGLFAQKV